VVLLVTGSLVVFFFPPEREREVRISRGDWTAK